MRLFWKLLLLALGLALFGWYISGIGAASVGRTVLSIGPWAPLVLLPYLVVYHVDCLAWAQTLPRAAKKIPFRTLLRIRWCGESINNLVPSGNVGGETLKVVLLRAHGITASDGASSAIVSKSAQTLAQLIFILSASILFLFLYRGEPAIRAGLIVICIVGCLAVAALFWIQSIGIFRMLIALSEKLRIKFAPLESRKDRLREIDATITAFYRRDPRRFYRATALYLAGWTLDTLEIYLVAHLLNMPAAWSQAIVVEAFTGVAKVLGMWVPGSLGIQESGIVLMGRLAGFSDTFCAAYALIRRARELIFAAVGMLFLYAMPSSLKPAKLSALTQSP
jgi:glycosyltransferase 2 family protein